MIESGGSVGLAFGLTIGAGLSTCIGGLIVFFKPLVHLTKPISLAISLSLSAGVMVFISLVEIFGESIESFKKGFEIVKIFNSTSDCIEQGWDFLNKTTLGSYCSHCNPQCEGHSWLAASATYLLGALIIFALDFIVAKISPIAHASIQPSDVTTIHTTTPNSRADTLSTSENANTQDCEKNISSKEEIFSDSDKNQLNRAGMLTALAIGLHNIPEGVATYIGAIGDTRLGAALTIGIALHNIPEGIAVAASVYFATSNRLKAFLWTFVSALAEPLGAIIAWLIVGDGLNPHVEGLMFGVVAGIMVTISFKEMLPNALKFYSKGHVVILSVLCGMGIMVLSLILFAYAGV